MARIMMVVDGQEYAYGTYPFGTDEEKTRVNEIALEIAEERGVYTYVLEI